MATEQKVSGKVSNAAFTNKRSSHIRADTQKPESEERDTVAWMGGYSGAKREGGVVWVEKKVVNPGRAGTTAKRARLQGGVFH